MIILCFKFLLRLLLSLRKLVLRSVFEIRPLKHVDSKIGGVLTLNSSYGTQEAGEEDVLFNKASEVTICKHETQG